MGYQTTQHFNEICFICLSIAVFCLFIFFIMLATYIFHDLLNFYNLYRFEYSTYVIRNLRKAGRRKHNIFICQNNLRIIPETILLKNSEELISRLPIERSYAWPYYQALHVQVIDNICCDTNFGEPIVKIFCFSCQAISIWRLQKFYFLNWHV